MLSYGDLYELLRKEKYSDNLQQLPKGFVSDMAEFWLNRRVLLVMVMDHF